MGNMAAKTTSERSYEEFEPYCKWVTEEGQKILEIDLKGFKKEQLKVQTKSKRILTINGEKPLGESSKKWIRFHREIRISKDCDMDGIHAKFSQGVLSIGMPKKETIQHAKDATMDKSYSICGLKTRKITAIKFALGVVGVVAIGTYIVRHVVNKHHHEVVGNVDVENV